MIELRCRDCGAVIEAPTEEKQTEVMVDHYAEEHGLGEGET